LTLEQVEIKSGVSNGYLSQVETGKRGIPSAKILKKLAPVYKIPYEELLKAAKIIEGEPVAEPRLPISPEALEIAKHYDEIMTPEVKEDIAEYIHFKFEQERKKEVNITKRLRPFLHKKITPGREDEEINY